MQNDQNSNSGLPGAFREGLRKVRRVAEGFVSLFSSEREQPLVIHDGFDRLRDDQLALFALCTNKNDRARAKRLFEAVAPQFNGVHFGMVSPNSQAFQDLLYNFSIEELPCYAVFRMKNGFAEEIARAPLATTNKTNIEGLFQEVALDSPVKVSRAQEQKELIKAQRQEYEKVLEQIKSQGSEHQQKDPEHKAEQQEAEQQVLKVPEGAALNFVLRTEGGESRKVTTNSKETMSFLYRQVAGALRRESKGLVLAKLYPYERLSADERQIGEVLQEHEKVVAEWRDSQP